MVLDAKALTWAAKNNIDTAKLKAAKVPIFGKWYFPEIPAGVPLVNLETGEQEIFPERMVAGEVIYVPAVDLVRAKLVPEGFAVQQAPVAPSEESGRALQAIAPEPLLAMARPPGYGDEAMVPVESEAALPAIDPAVLAGIHMPRPSIAPFVLGLGFCLVLLGAITYPLILVAGLVWMLAGAIGWIRVGLLEARAAQTHGGHSLDADGLEVEHAR